MTQLFPPFLQRSAALLLTRTSRFAFILASALSIVNEVLSGENLLNGLEKNIFFRYALKINCGRIAQSVRA
ncbi:MAG: hypothetical protein Q8K55_09770, partial [Gemmatimonadaceae bacterium]|nr:hypothetical protein [Gemmatimonadaceae bacterium]